MLHRGQETAVREGARVLKPKVYLLYLSWGLGDVLCCTPAIRALKRREPAATILFQTIIKGRHRVEYDAPGAAPGSGGAPDEMLWYNPHISRVLDIDERRPGKAEAVEMYYVKYGGPPLDAPLQGRYFDRLGLPWSAATRFDLDYYLQDYERQEADALLAEAAPGPYCALSPRVGWAGKMWTDEGWTYIIGRLRETGWTPVVLAGRHLQGRPWSDAINLSGTLDIRQTAGVVDRCESMLCTEGGLAHLRFALGKPAIVMTCATSYKVQVWGPPELITEVRNAEWCEPCMWRFGHVEGRPHVPPGDTHDCPRGKTLRDLTGEAVWGILQGKLP
jgi:hypothetical protein